jgi:drug/metabolite transporter (DMT)-like permease
MTTGASPATHASPRQVWAALWVVYLVWGSTYLGIKVVVDAGLPPLLGMGTRFVLSAALLAALIAVRSGPSALRVTRREVAGAGLVGVLLLLVGNGGVAVGEQTVPSGLAALLVGAVPLWLVLLRVGAGQRPRAATWAGVAVGFAGLAAISLPRGGVAGVAAWGVVVVLIATVGWSIGSFLSPRVGLPAAPLVATTWQMLIGGLALLAAGLVAGEAGDVHPALVPTRGWVALGYLVVVGSLAGYSAYVWLLGHAPLSLVSTYAYVNPVVAVLLGWAVLGEQVTPVIAAGGLVIVLGVALVVRGERPGPRRQPVRRAASARQAAATARKASLAAGSATVTRTPSSP